MADLATAIAKAQAIEKEMNTVVIDQPQLVHELWLATLSRGHLGLLGERGIAKTFAVDVMMAHMDDSIRKFYVLCSKSMDPQQLIGNISLKDLREKNTLAFNIKGKAPDVEILVLDEGFKNNSNNLNTLLGILNERRFVTNDHIHICPLITAVLASNVDEYPGDSGELSAFRDRFGSFLLIEPVNADDSFRQILQGQIDRFANDVSVPQANTMISREEIELLHGAVRAVNHPNAVVEALVNLRKRAEEKGLRPSARRFGQLMQRMAAQAVLNGRSETQASDITLAQHSLWTDLQDRPVAYELIVDYAGHSVSVANKLRKTLEPLVARVRELEAQVDPSVGPSNTQYGDFGKLHAESRAIEREVNKAIDAANNSGEDTTELATLKRDVDTVTRAVRGALEMDD